MTLHAHKCPNGHITYPGHRLCPDCGNEQTGTVDLSQETAEVVTWTTSTATPPGVRQPNTLAIVEFSVEGTSVRVLGQTTSDEIEIGDTVEPVVTEELREVGVGIKPKDSDRTWDGYRFQPM